jgi:hypothetical protein
MTISRIELRVPAAMGVRFDSDSLIVDLEDGRTISIPLVWYPRLFHATSQERENFRLIGSGEGIHWPDLDEDISIEHLILGIPSGESQASLQKWLEKRRKDG